MTKTWDEKKHMKAKRRVFASLFIVGACWVACWVLDPRAAAVAMLGNLYVGVAFYFMLQTYPEPEDRE